MLVAALIVALAFFGLLFWSLSGGWDGLRPAAQPTDAKVVAARSAARGPLDTADAEVSAALVPVTGQPAATGSFDGCREGDNNWKIKDGYTLRCQHARVSVTPLPDTSAATTSKIERALSDAGYHTKETWDQLDMNDSGHGEGLYTSTDGATTARVIIAPKGEPSTTSVYYPAWDVWHEADFDEVVAVTGAASTPLVTVIVTRTYFED